MSEHGPTKTGEEIRGEKEERVSEAEIEAADLNGERQERPGKKKGSENFRLTPRDVEILGFLLDQKFASLEQLYFRFFDVRKAVTDPLGWVY